MDIQLEGLDVKNAIYIILGTGMLIWLLRRVLPQRIEEMRIWEIILEILPVVIAACLALIPALAPESSWEASVVIGGVGGSVSGISYRVVRKIVPDNISKFLGSRKSRDNHD